MKPRIRATLEFVNGTTAAAGTFNTSATAFVFQTPTAGPVARVVITPEGGGTTRRFDLPAVVHVQAGETFAFAVSGLDNQPPARTAAPPDDVDGSYLITDLGAPPAAAYWRGNNRAR